jgi:hypothetical protein
MRKLKHAYQTSDERANGIEIQSDCRCRNEIQNESDCYCQTCCDCHRRRDVASEIDCDP